MSTKPLTGEESTGTQVEPNVLDGVPAHANYWGTDGAGDEHYWSVSEYTMYVDTDDGVEGFDIHETPCEDLVDWAIHIALKRGYWADVDLSAEAQRRLTAGGDH